MATLAGQPTWSFVHLKVSSVLQETIIILHQQLNWQANPDNVIINSLSEVSDWPVCEFRSSWRWASALWEGSGHLLL